MPHHILQATPALNCFIPTNQKAKGFQVRGANTKWKQNNPKPKQNNHKVCSWNSTHLNLGIRNLIWHWASHWQQTKKSLSQTHDLGLNFPFWACNLCLHICSSGAQQCNQVLLILIKGVKFAYANSPLTGVNASAMPAALKELRKQKKRQKSKKSNN